MKGFKPLPPEEQQRWFVRFCQLAVEKAEREIRESREQQQD